MLTSSSVRICLDGFFCFNFSLYFTLYALQRTLKRKIGWAQPYFNENGCLLSSIVRLTQVTFGKLCNWEIERNIHNVPRSSFLSKKATKWFIITDVFECVSSSTSVIVFSHPLLIYWRYSTSTWNPKQKSSGLVFYWTLHFTETYGQVRILPSMLFLKFKKNANKIQSII